MSITNQYSFDLFRTEANSWPSSLSGYLEDGNLCCMIHSSVQLSVGSGGCSKWRYGTHKSIQALYRGSNVAGRCYAYAGQLVLDRRVALEARSFQVRGNAAMGDGVVMGAKYRRGVPISVSAYGAGYCYLIAFSNGVRSRVARILGPLPYVADVLRMMRVLGSEYVSARWVPVTDNVFHVAPVSDPNLVPLNFFFRRGWDLIREYGSDIRVGVEFGAGFSNFVVSKLSGLIDTVSFGTCIWPDNSEREDEDKWLLSGSEVVPSVLDYSDISVSGKIKCTSCKYYVNPEGHAGRCIPKADSIVDGFDSFAAAWLGDVSHRRDVRCYVLISGVEKRKMGNLEINLVCREHQAFFYENYSGVKVPARGSSLHSLSTAFEESYYGRFRDIYLDTVLNGLTASKVPVRFRKFLGGV